MTSRILKSALMSLSDDLMDSIYDLEQVHGHSGFHRDLELWFGDEVADMYEDWKIDDK